MLATDDILADALARIKRRLDTAVNARAGVAFTYLESCLLQAAVHTIMVALAAPAQPIAEGSYQDADCEEAALYAHLLEERGE